MKVGKKMKTRYSLEKVKIKFNFFKHIDFYRIFKTIEKEHSIGSFKVFEGTLKECRDYLERNNIDLRKVY